MTLVLLIELLDIPLIAQFVSENIDKLNFI